MVLLLRKLGVYSVIIASLVSAVVEIILLRIKLKGLFAIRFNIFKIVGEPLILFLLIITLEPWLGDTHSFGLHLFYFLGCSVLLWWAYRNELTTLSFFRKE
jgi:hypothetical protein